MVNYAREAGWRDDRPSAEWAKGASTCKGEHTTYRRYKGSCPSSELAVIVAIAYAESGGRTQALGRSGGKFYIGPLQIQRTTLDRALFDPAANFRAGWGLYSSRGRRFSGTWSVFDSGRYRAFLGRAEAAVKSTHTDRPFVTRPGAVAESAFGWIGDVFGKYVVPVLKIGGGGVLMLTALLGVFAVMALGRDPAQAASNAGAGVAGVARIRTPARAAAVAARGSVRAKGRQELARARVQSRVLSSGRERVRISSRAEGRRRLTQEAELEAERREGSRRDRPAGGLRVIEGVGPGAKGRRRSAA